MAMSPRVFRQKERRAERDAARGTNKQRGYDEHWNRISRLKRDRQPICEVCHDAPADDVDHVIPFAGVNDPLRIEWSNLQSICRACHNVKTHGQKGRD